MRESYSDYDNFAWVYNKHWGMRFTPGSVAVLDEYVLPLLPSGSAILDLCCGTGQLANILSERGYRVTGIDGSAEMLKYARENAPDAEFYKDDARTFTAAGSFALVTSFFDSLNHVMTIEELNQVFDNVYSCLNEGGLFIFDLNLERGYTTDWHGLYGIIEDDHVCIFPQNYDPEKRIARFDATIFRLDDGWSRSEVTLVQRCYPEGEVRTALEKSAFSVIDVFAWTVQGGRQALTEDSKRAFFFCRK